MNTIGQIINTARVKKKLSFKKLEEITKIKAVFIQSIEEEKWNILPSFPTVLGFVKTLSTTLDMDPIMAVAVLKRDYPPKKTSINPKPDVLSKFSWNPKFTFVVGIITVILIVLGYLGYQYSKFISPPNLTVESPKENQIINGIIIPVFGSTDSDVKITVNNQPVLVNSDGKFSVNLDVGENTKEIVIIATNRSGKNTTIRRTINVQPN
jgi:cytoskeletal protein RodZ